MENALEEIEESFRFIAGRARIKPRVGIILGTGLGKAVNRAEVEDSLSYDDIPHFPASTVEGHAGRLLFGRLAGKKAVIMQGRAHAYEGYTPHRITLPVRVMKKLGIEALIVSNAAGGLNPLFSPGDVMVISDHINLTGMNPLAGPNLDSFGPRFPDMARVYDRTLIRHAEEAAADLKIRLQKGVYAGVLGPNLETPAETRFLRMIGADAVGMSTIPEVIVGIHCGLRVLGLSAISNVNLPDCMRPATLEEILEHAAAAGKKMGKILERVIGKI
jgi:purine-nucleoside phosphorylase